MRKRTLLGMLTPSSNTVLEPITTEMLRGLAHVSVHFSRLRVTEITLSEYGLEQFAHDRFLAAAELLADAKCRVIAWNGTSAGWRGFAHDEELCRMITERTGITATTSILAIVEAFRRHAIRRFGLVTPYTADVQARVVENFGNAGFERVAEAHLDLSDNFSFSEVPAEQILRMCREVAKSAPQAIAIVCTNLAAAPLAEQLESETGIPVYDSIAVVVRQVLELAGQDPSAVRGWGQIFQR